MQEEQKETAAGSPVASFQTRRDKPIEVMSLQEKFIELRRQIPRIEKGQHSEEVPYKFAKIDDVWFAESKNKNGNQQEPPTGPASGDGFMNIPEGADDQLPFN